MHVVVVGGGIAGLAAAWRLRQDGVHVTLVEKDGEAGGRCRSLYWHGDWRITGAMAFITSETNLIDQAKALGIYESDALIDMTGVHQHDVLVKRQDVLSIANFEAKTILLSNGIPAGEKLALSKVLLDLIKEMVRHDPHDPSLAASLDYISACAYFRKHSPTFVDYLLEPIMQHFCGYSEDDYSLAWLVWIMAGLPLTNSWWSFKDRGVGRLTYEMAENLRGDSGVEFLTQAPVIAARETGNGVEVDVAVGGEKRTISADAMVCAVPGSQVNGIVPGLDGARKQFFDQVQYVPLYLSYFLVELPEGDHPPALILPTVDGFETTAYYNIQPTEGRMAVIHGEVKGKRSRELRDSSSDVALDEIWRDIVTAAPSLSGALVYDRYLQRNDIAISRRHVGYTKALAEFKSLAPHPKIAFAGDYLIHSTVGQSHYSGQKAAEQLLRASH